jgi:predicted membrane-bound spermidine synthase
MPTPDARAEIPGHAAIPAPPPASATRSLLVLFVLFAISGFAGLIYESIWTHYLKLFLGHAAYAQALVLAIFMGGMAVGAWLASRLSRRWKNLLVAYAVTEAVIGVLALVFHETFVGATGLAYDVLLPRLAGAPLAVSLLKWTLSGALIVPQCVLLGMTFPLMTAGVIRAFPDRPGRSLAMLYFTNSLGAAAGVLVSGFLLVRLVGLPGTVRIAGVLNLAVAAAVWLRFGRGARAPAAASADGDRRPDLAFAGYLLVALVTGASSFIYEVAWIRMLSLVLGASTHAFEVMLSAFILGLALGGLWIQRRIDALPSAVRYLAVVQVAMGLLALATLPLYGTTFDVMQWLTEVLPRTDGGYTLFNLASNGIALFVMLPATFCAGMTLPLITYRLLRRGHGEASIGAVYTANTVGAILAVLFATHLGMPLLGLKGLLTLGAALDLALGVALAWTAAAAFPSRRVPLGLAAGSAAAVALVLGTVQLDTNRMASGVFRTGKLIDPGHERVVFHRDGKTSTISLIADQIGHLRISTNGKVDAGVAMAAGLPSSLDESTMILAGVIPLALRPEARTAATIGLGSGLTSHTLLSAPHLEQVDTVEIEEQVVEAAKGFRPRNERVYSDARSHITIDDAKTFFSTYGKRYDVIVSEPSNPWVSGVAGLFSDEFYRHTRRHLSKGGLFVQWIQLYEIDVGLVVSILKALDANFTDWVVYAANDIDAIVVASNGGELQAPSPAILRLPEVQAAMQRVGLRDLQDLEVRRIGSKRTWDGLTRSFDIPANSDFQPVVDQNAARLRFLTVGAEDLLVFTRSPLPVAEILSGRPPPWDWTAVARTPHFDGSLRTYQAMLLRDMVLRPEQPGIAALTPAVSQAAAPIAAWLRSCGPKTSTPLPLDSMLAFGEKAVANLTAQELARIWAPIESGRCAAQLTERDRAWFELVSAVSARDPARMAASSRALLERSPSLSPLSLRYLLAAGMLGAEAQGDHAAAAQLLARFGRDVDLSRYLLLRMLAARAGAGPR